MPKNQVIRHSGIEVIDMAVNSLDFAGRLDTVGDVPSGEVIINDEYVGEIELKNGDTAHRLDLTLEIKSRDASNAPTVSISVRGIFKPSWKDTPQAEIEEAILTVGAARLYSYAGETVSSLTQGGRLGKVILPLLSFSVTED